jgi:hypothetical protein
VITLTITRNGMITTIEITLEGHSVASQEVLTLRRIASGVVYLPDLDRYPGGIEKAQLATPEIKETPPAVCYPIYFYHYYALSSLLFVQTNVDFIRL